MIKFCLISWLLLLQSWNANNDKVIQITSDINLPLLQHQQMETTSQISFSFPHLLIDVQQHQQTSDCSITINVTQRSMTAMIQ